MSRYSTALIFIVFFLFSGCSQTKPYVEFGKKSFVNEDILIVRALEDQRLGKYKDAAATFKILYNKSKKINYLEEEAKMSFLAKDDNTFNLVTNALSMYPNNLVFKRILVTYYFRKKDYKNAEKISLELLKKDKNARNLSVLGDIYMMEKSYDLALKYYQSAFNVNKSQSALLNIVNLLYNFLDKKTEAISYLETFIRVEDAHKSVYFALIKIYGQEKNINGLISTYEKLYAKYKQDEYAKRVIELLMYKKDKISAIKFLEKSKYNPRMLLNIYTSNKDYKGAYKIATRLYRQTGDIDFLGKMAIFEYEANKDKLDAKILNSVSKKFERVLKSFKDPLYLNYYGYLLIDHGLNIEKGIKLVKMALKNDSASPFYLDSLAWGYYKLNQCRKALKIMKKIIEKTNEPEVLMHYNMIKKCIKEKK